MNIKENVGDGKATLIVDNKSLSGDIASDLKSRAVALIDSGNRTLFLDLQKPEYIDSSGIGKLLFMNKKMSKLGGTFEVIAINQTLYEFLDSLAITKVMQIASPR